VTNDPDLHQALGAKELHQLWEQLEDRQRIAFLGSLTEEAADRLLGYQLRLKEAETRKPRASQPAELAETQIRENPPFEPDDRMTDAELQAYITEQDAGLGQLQVIPADVDDRWTDNELATFIARQDANAAQVARTTANVPSHRRGPYLRAVRVRRKA
jgi:hypothetical protein